MVSTVDGAATGESGDSKSINNAADKQVFDLLREQADVLVVGAGTLRIEGYAVPPKPLVVVTRSGEVPRVAAASAGRDASHTSRSAEILYCSPCTSETTAMTDATPIITPSTVRMLRILLAKMARRAIFRFSRNMFYSGMRYEV